MFESIEADLRNWSLAYPTGIVARDGSGNCVKSDYCEEPEEFAEFFKENKGLINEETELYFSIEMKDLDSLLPVMKKINGIFEDIRENEGLS